MEHNAGSRKGQCRDTGRKGWSFLAYVGKQPIWAESLSNLLAKGKNCSSVREHVSHIAKAQHSIPGTSCERFWNGRVLMLSYQMQGSEARTSCKASFVLSGPHRAVAQ